MMKQKKIRLSSVADAKEFVRRAVECDFDVDVFYNRVIIDAKSILGVLSLDLTKELTVEYDGENQEFEEFLVEKDAAKVHAVAPRAFVCLKLPLSSGVDIRVLRGRTL